MENKKIIGIFVTDGIVTGTSIPPINDAIPIEVNENEEVVVGVSKYINGELVNPSAEELETLEQQKEAKEKTFRLIQQKKALLNKYREDVEQVDLFGMVRDDYEEKKELCKQLVYELRELEKNQLLENNDI